MNLTNLRLRPMRYLAGLILAAAALGGGAGCDETSLAAGVYGDYFYGDEASYYEVVGDNIDTTLGNFIDYGDGVAWTWQ